VKQRPDEVAGTAPGVTAAKKCDTPGTPDRYTASPAARNGMLDGRVDDARSVPLAARLARPWNAR